MLMVWKPLSETGQLRLRRLDGWREMSSGVTTTPQRPA